MDLASILIQLIGGVAGSKGITRIFKKLSSGPILDVILGLAGGFGGAQLAGLIPGLDAGGMDLGSVLINLLAGGIGGGALTAIGGLITQVIKK